MKILQRISLLCAVFCCFLLSRAGAQISNVPPAAVDPSAELQINSTSKGAVFPRMSASQRLGIGTPANGLLVFDTDSAAFMVYAGGGWTRVMTTNTDGLWNRRGDSIYNAAGTRVGIGTASPKTKFSVADSSLTAVSIRQKTLGGLSNKPALSVIADSGAVTTASPYAIQAESRAGSAIIATGYGGAEFYGQATGIYSSAQKKGGTAGIFAAPADTGTAIGTNGAVSIGPGGSPVAGDELLNVAGAIKLGNTFSSNEGSIRYRSPAHDFEGYDGSNWKSLTAGGSNWLRTGDSIYNAAGTRVGIGTAAPKSALHVAGSSVLFTSVQDTAAGVPEKSYGTRMMWFGERGALRAGEVDTVQSQYAGNAAPGDAWNKENIGRSSFATGRSTFAKGRNSVAQGQLSRADATNATAIGNSVMTAMQDAVVIGRYNDTTGYNGYRTTAPVFNLIGNGYTTPGINNRLFEIGNGRETLTPSCYFCPMPTLTPGVQRSNAMTVFQNGRVGIGTIQPLALVDIAGPLRIGNNSFTIPDTPGMMRFDGNRFQGYNGTRWVTFDSAGGGSSPWSASGANIYNNNTGNVGIGIPTPETALNVAAGKDVLFGADTTTTGGFWYNSSKKALHVGELNYNTVAWKDSATGPGSLSVGNNALAKGDFSVALGSNNKALDLYDFAAGSNNYVSCIAGVAFGQSNVVDIYSQNSFISGTNNLISAGWSGGFGQSHYVHGSHSFTAGNTDTTQGANSIALGKKNSAFGISAMATGENSRALGNYSTAMGNTASATGTASFASGNLTQATGDYSTAMGQNSIAQGANSTAVGYAATTGSLGQGAVSIGFNTTADGFGSMALGYDAHANGARSIAANEGSAANGDNAMAFGRGAYADGTYSSSLGYATQAHSFGSTALGSFNDTTGAGSTSAFNLSDHLLTVGNGSLQGRSNAMTMLKNGRTGFGVNQPLARVDVAGPIRVGASSGYADNTGMIRYNSGVFEGYDGAAWSQLNAQSLSISGSTLSISGGNSVTLPSGVSGSGQWNAVNTDDIKNGNSGRVLIGSDISTPSSQRGRLTVRDTIAFGAGIRSFTNAAYESAVIAHDSGVSGNPRGGVFYGIPATGQEGVQAYSKLGDGLFAYTTNGRGIYLKGGNQSNYAMVIDTNGSNGSGNTGALGALKLNAPLMLSYGSPAAGKVLTSDASGVASWQPNTSSYTAGSGISISGGNVISATDNSATNEIQNLSITGNVLSISGGNNVTLPAAASQWGMIGNGIRNTSGIQVAINRSPGGTVPLVVMDSIGNGNVIAMESSSNSQAYSTVATAAGIKGYYGVAHAGSDIDLGTVAGNNAGKVNLVIEGQPRLSVHPDGRVMIGNGTPLEQLEVAGAIRLGYTTGTTNGAIRYNNAAGRFEGYHNGWLDLSAPAGSNYWTQTGADIFNNNPGKVGIGTATPLARLHVEDSSVLFRGPASLPFSPPAPPVTGSGNRTMWYAERAAFRTGGLNYLASTRWNKDSIGVYSFASGLNNQAKGVAATALGQSNRAQAESSTAIGENNLADAFKSTAIGENNIVSGISANAIGQTNVASGNSASAVGSNNIATGSNSLAAGKSNTAIGGSSSALGAYTVTNAYASTALGFYSDTLAGADEFSPVATDAVLTVGNGTSPFTRHNALTILKNGNLGISTDTAQQRLDVAGGMRLGNTATSIAGSLRFNGTDFEGHDGTSWKPFASAATNSWAVSGADIYNSNPGKVGIGTAMPLAKLHVADSNVLFEGPASLPASPDAPPQTGAGNRTMWYADKAAFRAGGVSGSRWDADSIGEYSFASGMDNRANGRGTTAMGEGNIALYQTATAIGANNFATGVTATAIGNGNSAEGFYSLAAGSHSIARGTNAVAIGTSNVAYGTYSTVLGAGNITNSYSSTALGIYSDTLAGAERDAEVATDPLLTVGNGQSTYARHNALTMLRNGKTGFNTDSAQAELDVHFNSNVTEPHLRLYENGDDYARLTFSNSNNASFWSLNGYNSASASAADRFVLYNSSGGDVMTMTGDGNMGVKSPAPNSRMQVSGSFATAIIAKTAAYTATIEDHTITADASSAAFSVTLPTAIGIEGRMYVIKRLNSGSNDVTIQADGSETIDGSNTQTLSAQWKYMTLQSDGAGWIIIGNN